jgi:undecaprenyl-diphosphatase
MVIALKYESGVPIGDLGIINLHALNNAFRGLFEYDRAGGYFRSLYIFTEILGAVSILACVFWTGLGIKDLIKYRDINDVDKSFFATWILYVLALIVWKVVLKIAVNYAPVSVNLKSGLVVSFPCGNTFLIIISMCSSIYLIGYFLEEKKNLVLTLRVICVAVLVLGIVFRTVSGVNYLTDILGAIGFAVPLVVLYSFVCDV